jgi:hypothetical protein
MCSMRTMIDFRDRRRPEAPTVLVEEGDVLERLVEAREQMPHVEAEDVADPERVRAR